jgi:hypothetical protein
MELPPKKVEGIRMELNSMMHLNMVPWKQFEKLRGKLVHACIGLPAGRNTTTPSCQQSLSPYFHVHCKHTKLDGWCGIPNLPSAIHQHSQNTPAFQHWFLTFFVNTFPLQENSWYTFCLSNMLTLWIWIYYSKLQGEMSKLELCQPDHENFHRNWVAQHWWTHTSETYYISIMAHCGTFFFTCI